ncbi:MAG: hypothetical protein GWN99_00545 [Gemmatimonadetes bacterium]|uniref:Uncharacterized protein n=1 Tax=Candidatus Kutchimonas denitrificans TaxID=3056748 RepID=A0AAE4Z7D3_9BACT|nr:hypothetical protein [Gemmatimonadota bacterium]NIR73596.1 hypothetical protein [Candidatus Kutchimonas denitrificans]NIR99555.1 hypothetical protein [Gemmatimonadota bacterium]NIT65175.1 hypothetical protein [Gemmatimonadota bacterium]NIV23708.1 hypothetical protein [Gemmatimonadota bacterium]
MWFGYKKSVAPLYKDETNRRAFATASGRDRPKGVDKLKKMELADDSEESKSWLARLFSRSK